ncbi:MAG: ribonuclease Y [Clostridiales bacterium]|nr:ribonuclease Y [Clostridiales bacterium]
MNNLLLAVNTVTVVLIALGTLIVGGVVSFWIFNAFASKKLNKNKTVALKIIEDAYAEAKTIKKEALLEAKEESSKIKEETTKELSIKKEELKKTEDRIALKEDFIDKKDLYLDKKQQELDEQKKKLDEKDVELAKEIEKQGKIYADMVAELEKVALMSKEDAKNLLVNSMTEEARKDAAKTVRQIEEEARETARKQAQNIVSLAIQKCATDMVAEATISTVTIPNEEMKGRIIGREGRNIRAIEAATGVDLIVDDTPETITLSCFDPIRREVARLSLEKLIVDGRIHPTRIEEIVEKVKRDLDIQIKEAGEEAVNEAGVYGLHPEIIKTLGRLKYRTSYGQNVLKHSLETSYLAGLLAAEVGADVKVAKRGGLLHDIGKALDHETEGTHVQIGVDLAKKHRESQAVIHCIEAHHFNVEFNSIEAILVQVADAISSARPGARRESMENYVKRLEQLESIANEFKGVEKSFAVQAGREVRIIVKPEQISDEDAMFMAKDIAKKIEDQMEYPGQIKVNVIRESRFTETAK